MWSNPFGSFKCKWTQYERVTNYDISMRQKNVGARLFQEKISAKLYIRRSEWKQMQRIWVVIYINLNANKKTIYPNKIRYTSFPIGMNSTQNSLVEICWRSMHTEIGFIGLHYTCDYIMQVTMLYDSMYKGGTNLILESCMLRKYQSMRGMNSHLRSSTHDWNRDNRILFLFVDNDYNERCQCSDVGVFDNYTAAYVMCEYVKDPFTIQRLGVIKAMNNTRQFFP